VIAFQMSEEQMELVSLVRDVLKSEVEPLVLEMDRRQEQDFDWRPVEALARLNMVAPIVPEEYGGRGLDFVTTALIIEEVAAVCAGLAACMVGTIHALLPILVGGDDEQKKRFLVPLVSHKPALASFALTEPKGGSDIQRLDTYYQPSDDGFILNGNQGLRY
jgi:alkylation response protein AidB-like acyl-CoA dehydrogenase